MREDELRYEEPAEVSAEDAYRAAVERAARTQEALILAEAQILAWKRRYLSAMGRAEVAEERLGEVQENGAQESTGDGAEVCGEADSQGPVPF